MTIDGICAPTENYDGQTAALPADYNSLLIDIKNRIRTAQIRASLSVNRELIQLYWDIGHLIVERQRVQGWGKSVVERLAADIQKGFPGMRGFSPQNIWYMRSFYLAWTDDVESLQRLVGESDRVVLQRAVGESRGTSPPGAAAQSEGLQPRPYPEYYIIYTARELERRLCRSSLRSYRCCQVGGSPPRRPLLFRLQTALQV